MFAKRLVPTLALLITLSAFAGQAPFGDLHWRLIGPFRGGRVLAVTGVPSEPEHFYFGSVNGGVWETKDSGRTWEPIFDSQPVGSIGAIAVAPSNAKVIYVGSGEADMRSDIAQGDGMYKSSDGGKSWSKIGLGDSQQIARIAVHPSNPDLVYVAVLGHPYGPNAERGLYRSKDGGKSWQRILSRNDSDTGAVDVRLDPSNPNTIYAALWQTRRTPWSIYPPSNGPGSGLFKSTDGGDTWTEIKGNGFAEKPGRIGIAIAPSQPQRVYTVVDAPAGGIYRSDDGGATWTRSSSDARVWSRGWYFGEVDVEPRNADVVYSINVNVYRSDDAGKTFVPVKGAPGGDDYHSLWIDPQHPERRILGVDQGCVVSLNGGATWSSWFNQPTGQFYHVVTDNRFPYWVYGAQQDSGAAGVPSRTNTVDGINITQFREITAGGESDNVAPDPNDPETLYGGRVEKLDTRTYQTQSVDPTIAYPNIDRRTWTLPLTFSHRDSHVLYFANQRLFRTEDGGNHWTVISDDLTRENPGVPANLDAATAELRAGPGSRFGVIYAIAPSRLADHDIWAGTDDGQIWRTRDEGAHWDNITPPALTGWSKVGIIDTSHFDAETAYAAVDRHRIEDVRPYIYRTHDGGKHWELVVNGIPNGSFVNAVREDSVRKGLLYAGTEKGMYVSFDDGDHWQSMQLNLPITSVRDIDVHDNDLVIATHGRAFWVMDDVSPIRVAPPTSAAAFLFPPAVAVRERGAGFTGSPMPKDEALAANPSSGAYIDYILPADAKAPVTIDITDLYDNVVRSFSSADKVPQPDLSKLNTAPEWFSAPSHVAFTAGMHRFVWSLHFASLTGRGRRGAGAGGDGVWAPPGKYKVVLTFDGQKLTQPLTVVPDPRIKLPQSAYNDQFALAREIEAERVLVSAAVEEAGKMAKTSNDPRLHEIADMTPEGAWWLAPASTTSLRYIDTALGNLQSVVDSADAAPTADARAAWAKLKPAADAVLAKWREFKASVP